LSQINENVDESNIVRSNSRELLLPLNTLDEIKAFGDSTPPQQGKITAISEGEEDTVQITSPQASELISGDIIQITDTQSYNGHYKAIKVDENTFEIEASFVNGDIGNWEVVPEVETGLTFDGAITAFERVADNRLKITAENHGLEDGDEVQILDTTDYNQTFAIEKINEKNFVIDGISWQSGEVVNLKSHKRRGVMFEGSQEEYIAIPALELTPPSEEFAFGYTFSAWIDVANSDNSEQVIIGEKNKCFRLLVNNGKVSFEVKFDDVKQISDTEAVSTNKSNKWVHYAGIIKSDGTSNQTTLTLCKNGQQVGETLVEALPNTPENWQPEFEIGKSFSGKIADVRIWDAARMVKEIKDSMYLQLTGREVDLAGYWRLGAITEGKERLVVDFSANGNDGIVYGEAFVSAVTLKRTLGDGNTKVVKYSNDDLVAVTARATYVESFEFKVDGDVDSDSLFNFSYWGKKSRNSEEKIEFSGESNFKRLDNNWYKATCRFTVPDEVAMMRTFELADVQGDWENLEIRKHRVRLVSDSITQQKFIDNVELETLAEQNAELPGLLKTLEQKEREEASLLLQKWKLEDLKVLGIAELQREIETLDKEVKRLESIYNKEKANSLNYWCKIQTNTNEYFHFRGDSKFITRYHEDPALFKFVKQANWYEIETDTNIGHLRGYASNRKYLHFNREKVLCPWSNVPAQFKFEKDGDWYIAKLNTGIGNLRGTNYQYLHFDGFNNLVAWKDTPAKFKFIKDSEEPTNDNISDAKSKWEAKKNELAKKQEQLETIKGEFGGNIPNKNQLELKLEDINTKLEPITKALDEANQDITQKVRQIQQEPQTLPTIPKESSQELITKGALLEFVSPASRIKAIETCEGNVQLSYSDNQGRMRLTNYDATSDSQNTAFEQWLPDELPVCLNLANDNDKIELAKPIKLTQEWTIETCFSYPLPKQTWNTLACSSNNTEQQIVVYQGKWLGTRINGFFHNSGYNLETITNGWHHLTVVGKGMRVEEEAITEFCIDGKTVGKARSSTALVLDGKNDYVELPEMKTDFSKGFTVEAWVYYDSFKKWSRIIDFGEGAGQENILLANYGTTSKLVLDIYRENQENQSKPLAAADVLEKNKWIHLAATVDSSGNAKLFKNGEEVASGEVYLPKNANRNNNYIGKSNWEDYDEYFDGKLAEVRIWNKARTQNQIQADMGRVLEGEETNLVGYWRFSNNSAKDLSSNKNNGTLQGEPETLNLLAKSNSDIKTIGNTQAGSQQFGKLAEFRVWNIALSHEEIAVNSKTRLSGNEPGLIAY
ncbi:MAG: LamG-like jellyroll fold domain-containing protein, partial [Cyanobacteria bacterium J06643_5]